MCDFCKKFDFSTVKPHIDVFGARIHLALGVTKFPRSEQFNYCPVCGEKRGVFNEVQSGK